MCPNRYLYLLPNPEAVIEKQNVKIKLQTHTQNIVPGYRNPHPCATTTGLILQQSLQAAASREVFFPPTENLLSPAALERMIVLLLSETLHQKTRQILQEAGAGLQLHNNNQTTSDARAS